MKFQIVDDFLPKEEFSLIKDSILARDFPWHISPGVSYKDSNDGYYLSHHIYYCHTPLTRWYEILNPIIVGINPIAIHRIKANFYPTTKTLIKHAPHIDLDISHKGAIIYLNTNDGKTILNDGTEIESIENRILFFDPSIPHQSTSCTNHPLGRFNINLNYF